MNHKPFTVFRVLENCCYGRDNNPDYEPLVVADFVNEDNAKEEAFRLQENEGWDFVNYNNDFYTVEKKYLSAREFYQREGPSIMDYEIKGLYDILLGIG